MTKALRPYPAYKNSGVPWLGRVPEHWDVLPNRVLFTEAAPVSALDGPDNGSEVSLLIVTAADEPIAAAARLIPELVGIATAASERHMPLTRSAVTADRMYARMAFLRRSVEACAKCYSASPQPCSRVR